jgi:hypothetical protein
MQYSRHQQFQLRGCLAWFKKSRIHFVGSHHQTLLCLVGLACFFRLTSVLLIMVGPSKRSGSACSAGPTATDKSDLQFLLRAHAVTNPDFYIA